MALQVGKLSKNLLRMKITQCIINTLHHIFYTTTSVGHQKFMQRSLDAKTKKQLEEDEKRIISDEHWYLDLPELKEKESFIIEERSFHPCEDFLYGRMSFKGFNPEVEKLMVQMNSKTDAETVVEEGKMEVDITDEEMAQRYESLVGTIQKKFAKKRDQKVLDNEDENQNIKSSKIKKAFLKPQD